MVCQSCGKSINAMDTRCMYCGTIINKGDEATYGRWIFIGIVTVCVIALIWFLWGNLPGDSSINEDLQNISN